MVTDRARKIVVLAIVLQVAAVALGLGAALAVERTTYLGAVHALNRCTKYAPGTNQTWPCDAPTGTIVSGTSYSTSSFAWRDSNELKITTGATRWWEIYLKDTLSNSYQYTGAFSSGGTSGGQAAVQTKAYCSILVNQTNATGFCRTFWHD